MATGLAGCPLRSVSLPGLPRGDGRQPDGHPVPRRSPAASGSSGLEKAFGKYLWIDGVSFPHGQEVVDRAVEFREAVTFRFVRRLRKGRPVWYVHATTKRPAVKPTTDPGKGCLGVDLNGGSWSAV